MIYRRSQRNRHVFLALCNHRATSDIPRFRYHTYSKCQLSCMSSVNYSRCFTSDDLILLVVTVVCNRLHRPRRSSLLLYPHQWFCWIPIRRRRYTSITLGAYSHRSSPSTIEPLIMPTAYLPQPSLSQPVAGKVQPRMGKLQALSGPSSYPGTSASGSHAVTSQTFPLSHPVGTHLIMTQQSSYVPMWKIYAEKWRRYGLIGHTSLLHHMGSLIQK
jgi:hypothetical protein